MRGRIVEGCQIRGEPARDHVQEDTTFVQMRERTHDFGDGIRMHVGRLHCHERTELLGILQNDLRNKPGIDQGVVGIDENPLAPAFFAPARDSFHLIDVLLP